MAWLFRLPRVLGLPIALLCVALAGCALAVLACSMPLILAYLSIRRSLGEWSARRTLMRVLTLQGASLHTAHRAPGLPTAQPADAVKQLAEQQAHGP